MPWTERQHPGTNSTAEGGRPERIKWKVYQRKRGKKDGVATEGHPSICKSVPPLLNRVVKSVWGCLTTKWTNLALGNLGVSFGTTEGHALNVKLLPLYEPRCKPQSSMTEEECVEKVGDADRWNKGGPRNAANVAIDNYCEGAKAAEDWRKPQRSGPSAVRRGYPQIRVWAGLEFGKSQRAEEKGKTEVHWLRNHLWCPNDPRG